MRHIKTHSIELKPGHLLIGMTKGRRVDYYVQTKQFVMRYFKGELITLYNFNPDDHDLSKLGTEVKE